MNQSPIQQALVAAYAAGALEPGLRLLVETYAALSSHAAEAIDCVDLVGGAFLETESPTPMGVHALRDALALIDRIEGPSRSIKSSEDSAIARLPAPVRLLASSALESAGWHFSGFGIRSLPLDVGSACKVELLRIEPGAKAPRHTHDGAEYTLVLAGAFRDANGLYGPGDIVVAGPGVTHQPVAEGDEVCFSLAVSESSPKLLGSLGLLQKLWPN